MGTVNNAIATLLESNRVLFDGKPIAFDGIVDEASYNNSKIKTLFLLKEVNDPNMGEDWETFMEDTKRQASVDSMYKTWPNVCLWIEALNNESVSYSECVDEQGYFATKRLQRNLLDVAIVNIKKTAGGGSSKHAEILAAVNNYGGVIREEIELIKPQLVICGGTFDYVKIILGVEPDEIKNLPSGAQYFMQNNACYLRFVHPMWYSVNRSILFAYAKAVFADVRQLSEALA